MTSSYVLVNDLRIHYRHWGEAGAVPPLLLLHGLASNARIWDKVAPHLAAAGLHCIAPDLRGHGLSDKSVDGYSFEQIGRDLAVFMQRVQIEEPVVVGHSWGASLALDLAARQRVGSGAPRGIVLVDGGFVQMDQVPGATWENMRERLTPPKLAGTPVDDFVMLYKDHNASWGPDDEAVSIVLANFAIHEDETITPHLSLANHMQILKNMWDFKTYERFERVFCPVLAIPARPKSPASPAESAFLETKTDAIARFKNAHPAIEVHWMEDTIHDIPLQRPGELAEMILRFLDTMNNK